MSMYIHVQLKNSPSLYGMMYCAKFVSEKNYEEKSAHNILQ